MKTYIAGGLLGILGAAIITSYILHLQPRSKQGQLTLGFVIGSSIATGLIGFLYAYLGLKGNTTAQLHFFIPLMILVLLPTCIISATVSANQLYGLREAVAVGKSDLGSA